MMGLAAAPALEPLGVALITLPLGSLFRLKRKLWTG
jgi:hypothetical protein